MKLDVHCACKPAAESLGTVYWTNVSNLQPVFKYLIISKKIALKYTVPRVFAFSTVRQKKKMMQNVVMAEQLFLFPFWFLSYLTIIFIQVCKYLYDQLVSGTNSLQED